MPGLVQITVPPSSTALTTLANAKDDLNQTDNYDNDAYIGKLIERASSVVAGFCARSFGLQTVAETFRVTGRNTNSYMQAVGTYGTPLTTYNPFMLTHVPIQSVVSVTEGTTTLGGTDYEWDRNVGSIWRVYAGVRSAWIAPLTTITYTAGYVLPLDGGTPTLPAAIEEVTLSLVRGAFFARGGDPHIIMELVEGVGRNTYAPTSTISGMEIDANSARTLAPYKQRIW